MKYLISRFRKKWPNTHERKKYKNIDFYLYYIEKDTDINFDTNEKMGTYEYIKGATNV